MASGFLKVIKDFYPKTKDDDSKPFFGFVQRFLKRYRLDPLIDSQKTQQDLFQRINIALYKLDSETLELVESDEAIAHFLDIEVSSQNLLLPGKCLKSWLNPIEEQRVSAFFSRLNEGERYELKYQITTYKDQMKWVLDKGIKKKCQNKYLCFGVWKDITEFQLVKQSLDFLSSKDPLTGLLNRFAFNDVFEQWVERQGEEGRFFALVKIQVDNYRKIKDTLGVDYIDQFDRIFSSKLKDILGSSSVLSKQGEGLFGALIPLTDIDDKATVVEYCSLIQKYALSPVVIKQCSIESSISFGIAMCPKDAVDSYSLTRQADIALRKVFEIGGDHQAFFSEKMHESIRFETMVENELLVALRNHQFYLEFQPQVDMSTGHILAAEALVRWRHPVHGSIAPMDFIGIAEVMGIIRELGMWVFSQACKVCSSWIDQLQSDVVMSVNISPIQLDESFVDFVHRTLEQYQLPASCLEIEITEKHLLEHFKHRIGSLRALSKMGLSLVIDDFGTGHCSLNCLRQLPFKKIKIDRSLIKELKDNEPSENNSIIQAILAIGNRLDIMVLAEGVETEWQEQYLKEQGCPAYQGYFFSQPVSSVDMIKLYHDHVSQRAVGN